MRIRTKQIVLIRTYFFAKTPEFKGKEGGKGMGQNYRHITFKERKMIEKLYKDVPIPAVARVLRRSYGTVYRELTRCPKGKYNAVEAQADYEKKLKRGTEEKIEKQKNHIKETHKKLVRVCLEMDPDINDREIAKLTGISVDEVKEIRKQPGREKRKEMQTE